MSSSKYGHAIDSLGGRPSGIEPLQLVEVLESMPKPKSSPGLDGWRFSELAKLPVFPFHRLGQLLQCVEHQAKWPCKLLLARVVLLRKDLSGQPLRVRPIVVLPSVLRLWSRARFLALTAWQASWRPGELFGAVPNCSTTDITYRVLLQMEHSHAHNLGAIQIMIDKTLCFDRISRRMIGELFRRLGLHPRLVATFLAYANNLQRMFELNGAEAIPFIARRGCAQGCVWSVMAIKALTAVLCAQLSLEDSLGSCVYYDDFTHSCSTWAQVQNFLDHHAEWDRLTGMLTNATKSEIVKNSRAGNPPRQPSLAGVPVPIVSHARLLGVDVKGATFDATFRKGKILRCLRIITRAGNLPLPFDKKAHIIAAKAGAILGYIAWTEIPSREEMGKWRAAVNASLWKRMQGWLSPASHLALVLQAHRVDIWGIVCYQTIIHAARAMASSPWIRECFMALLLKRRERAVGPCMQLLKVLRALGYRLDPDLIARPLHVESLPELPCVAGVTPKLKHDVRTALRQTYFRECKGRADLVGARDGVNIELTVRHLRQLQGQASREFLDEDYEREPLQAEAAQDWSERETVVVNFARPARLHLLRIILTGSLHTGFWWHKACQYPTAECQFCHEEDENLIHVYHRCTRWAGVRRASRFYRQFRRGCCAVEEWPACLASLGILPLDCHALGNSAREALPALQDMMIDIVETRAKLEAANPVYKMWHAEKERQRHPPPPPEDAEPARVVPTVDAAPARRRLLGKQAVTSETPLQKWHLADEYPRYPRWNNAAESFSVPVSLPTIKPVHAARWTADWLNAATRYLASRRWSYAAKITWIELVLDLVIEIRMFPINLGTTSTVAELSESMLRLWQLLSCQLNSELSELPRTVLSYSLHALGMRRGSGLDVRCQISDSTMRVLQRTIEKPTVIDKGWNWVPSWTDECLSRFRLPSAAPDIGMPPSSAVLTDGTAAS